jgi:DNA gyrase subunit A
VFLGSAKGKSIRFHESDVRPSGRATRGVRGFRLSEGDAIVGMEVMRHGQTLFTVTENGYGKRTAIEEYPLRKRGGMGVITIKTSVRNGMVVAILLVGDDDDVMLVTDTGRLIRMPVEGISVISRNTQGFKLMGVAPGERVAAAIALPHEDEEDDELAEDGSAADGADAPTAAEAPDGAVQPSSEEASDDDDNGPEPETPET